MMRVTDRIVAPSRGTAARAIAFATSNGAARLGEATSYINEVYRLAPALGIDPSIPVAQSVQETSLDNGRPWASSWWVGRLNPAGIGITGDPAENAASHTWATGTEAARAQLSHLLVYAMGPTDAGSKWFQVTGESIRSVDVRYDAYLDAYGNTAQAQIIEDLAGTWAVDMAYPEGVVAKGNAIYPNLPDQEGPPVPTYSRVVPGLPGGPLLTDYQIIINLIPTSSTRQRPGITAHTPRRSVQHGTGNPNNPNALDEAMYFVNGAEGRQASVHYCTDDWEAVVVVPLNEVTWQAADGSGPGNMNGFSCEMMEADAIWNDAARRGRLIAITADLMGRTAARLGAIKPEQHWDFNYNNAPSERHDCPNKLRYTKIDGIPAWEIYSQRWQAARADELARMAGTPTTTTTAPPPPPPPLVKRTPIPMPADAELGTLFWVGTRLYQVVAPERVKMARNARQYAAPDGKSIASNTILAKGKWVTMPYVVAGDDRLLYRASKSGTHIRAENLIPRRATAEGG